MPYALFSDDAKLSKVYPTREKVWEVARAAGLIHVTPSADPNAPAEEILDHSYEIRACEAEPGECPYQNVADANQDQDFQLTLQGR